MQRFIVNYMISSTSENYVYYQGPIAKEIFQKYIDSGQYIVVEDKIIENSRYVTVSYSNEESCNSLLEEIESLGDEIKNKDAVIETKIIGYQEVS